MKRLFSEIPYIETERLVLRKIEETDEGSLSELVHSQNVYRYLSTFLFEHKYENIHDVSVICMMNVSGIKEDWGYTQPTSANKWIWRLKKDLYLQILGEVC